MIPTVHAYRSDIGHWVVASGFWGTGMVTYLRRGDGDGGNGGDGDLCVRASRGLDGLGA